MSCISCSRVGWNPPPAGSEHQLSIACDSTCLMTLPGVIVVTALNTHDCFNAGRNWLNTNDHLLQQYQNQSFLISSAFVLLNVTAVLWARQSQTEHHVTKARLHSILLLTAYYSLPKSSCCCVHQLHAGSASACTVLEAALIVGCNLTSNVSIEPN